MARITRAIEQHPDRDAEGLAEKLATDQFGGTTKNVVGRFVALLPREAERPAQKPWPPSEVPRLTLATSWTLAGMYDDLEVGDARPESLKDGVLYVLTRRPEKFAGVQDQAVDVLRWPPDRPRGGHQQLPPRPSDRRQG